MTRSAPHRHPPGTKVSRAATKGTPPMSPARAKRRIGSAVLLILLAAGLVVVALSRTIGAGGDRESRAGGSADPGVAHIHGLGVDPGDKTLYAATLNAGRTFTPHYHIDRQRT
jgi:hypothetical protein